ncbi:hypothetical protein RSPO_m01161 (plasmid) [Ralstonia solanacearum Po82]|uniref:Uncharacterized protein n=1 Tax=Ralstonia solanacearum (strain Po82) TaxID=1031711 RepID=F6GAK9_RALS8|nr:hypothetical protein RSPO_m01161 [Ralstonia solanacearum Po82]
MEASPRTARTFQILPGTALRATARPVPIGMRQAQAGAKPADPG